ncbi:STE/STE11/CDC15 protein kinase [Emergomyces pasteurianus Ep9510]|uniref:Cytokinesis protein sepH n=1 Tax=Emergomyces pasteurianus Ep9510 TaxID=1447872 RepID=A0A1J9PCN3_9EURO|nr:STE/STE11/CDC15 protein kinase [Emergomyces pasteurianus Ep9510]
MESRADDHPGDTTRPPSRPSSSRPPQENNNHTPTNARSRLARSATSPSKREPTRPSKSTAKDVAELTDFQLGDCLGKGAFGSVYRALNWGTGETVAVKQIKLTDLPKSELRVIMQEIDLLKNLDHPNIVKYHGFVKSIETLNIILEYCENGSLHSISKNFGRFPENLVRLYMSQVLHGLLYLHEQGVIHRDIKGANILTTKQGLVKLADFGVASRTTGLHESSVVGTPYWMAPEVIELSGATTASDIWSLGCTVIELLEGKPPYYKFQPMQALFRIVNDDHPPLPQGASPAVRDFLMQCFQKDPNLRVTARKLLKHPWIVNARRSDSVVPTKSTEYEEAVKSVQEWNEALRSPDANSARKPLRPGYMSPGPGQKELALPLVIPSRESLSGIGSGVAAERFRSPDGGDADDNWDDDFASAISPSALRLPHLKPHDNFGGMLSSEKLKAFASFESVAEFGTIGSNNNGPTGDDDNTGVNRSFDHHETDPLQTIRPFALPHRLPEEESGGGGVGSSSISPPKHSRRSRQRKFSIPPTKAPGAIVTPRSNLAAKPARPAAFYKESSVEDYSDLIAANDAVLEKKLRVIQGVGNDSSKSDGIDMTNSTILERSASNDDSDHSPQQSRTRRRPPMSRSRSSIEIEKFAEDENDEDFSDILGNDEDTLVKAESDDGGSDRSTLMLNSKLSCNSWLGDVDDEDDPFAQLEEGLDEMDLEANIARDKYARLRNQVEGLVSSLKTSQEDDVLTDISEQLMILYADLPETKSVIISAHGMLPILEILENCRRRDVISNLLKIVNAIIFDDYEIQENLCFVGGIPIINKFASKKYPREIRLEAAAFVQQMYQTSTLTLQMFVSAGGLNVLVEFLEDDYEDERDLVLIGVNGIWSVFELQGSTPKNDFCRILSRNSVLDPLSLVLSRVLDEEGELAELCEGRIANIFFIFSQAESYVKEMVAERTVLHRVLKELKRMTPVHQITMLKFIKNLSMLSTTLECLQNSNAIDVLTELLRSTMKGPHFREVSNQILNTIYNMCRLSKPRQEDAALNGIIPLLQKIVKTERPLKEFALPILCDMAHSGKVGRRELWRNKGLPFYVSLLSDPYWQVTALDAIFTWLQEETAKVEEHLLDDRNGPPPFVEAIIRCLTISKANAFENLLEPLQKLLRLSPPIASTLARPDMFSRIGQKLHHTKPAVRVNLLRILSTICDSTDDHGNLLSRYGLLDAIRELQKDSRVLVRELAGQLIKSSEESDATLLGSSAAKRRTAIRRPSTSTTPPTLISSHSMPTTPQIGRSSASKLLYEGRDTPRRRENGINGAALGLRPGSRDGRTPPTSSATAAVMATGTGGGGAGSVGVKGRLPRAMTQLRPSSSSSSSQQSSASPLASSPQLSEDIRTPTSSTRLTSSVVNARRRRTNTGGSGWT